MTSLGTAFSGLYRQQPIAMRDLTIVFVAAIVLLFALPLLLFGSFIVAAIVIAMPVLAMGAVLVGLWLKGTERNIAAIIGMMMVIGIVTEIAIFYFSEFRALTQEGHGDALIQAGVDRFRPIAMTTIAAILALFLLALALGQGSAILKQLAIAIISGLIVQIPLLLWVMPVAYSGLSRIHMFDKPVGRRRDPLWTWPLDARVNAGDPARAGHKGL